MTLNKSAHKIMSPIITRLNLTTYSLTANHIMMLNLKSLIKKMFRIMTLGTIFD